MQEETFEEAASATSQEPENVNEEPSDQQSEPQSEQPRLYAGKYKSPEELEMAYLLSNAEATKMAQKVKEYESPQYSNEDQQILKELKTLGVMTKQDLTEHEAIQNLKAADDAQIRALKLTSGQENTLRKYAAHKDNQHKTMIDCWQEITDTIGTSGTVLARKTTIKPRTGNKSSTGQVELSQSEIARLPDKEYNQYWADFAAKKAA